MTMNHHYSMSHHQSFINHQSSSIIINHHQSSSIIINHHQSSITINHHQSSIIINRHQSWSMIINHQWIPGISMNFIPNFRARLRSSGAMQYRMHWPGDAYGMVLPCHGVHHRKESAGWFGQQSWSYHGGYIILLGMSWKMSGTGTFMEDGWNGR